MRRSSNRHRGMVGTLPSCWANISFPASRCGLRSHAHLFVSALLVAVLCILSPSAALAGTNGTWINTTSSGLWSSTGNWSGGIVADGSNGIADFSTLNITANETVRLDSARTIGALKLGDTTPSNDWTLDDNSNSANVLTLAVSSGSPLVQVNNQAATISAALAGSQGLSEAGNGTLVLAGANTISGTTTVGGTMQLANANALQNSILSIAGGNVQFQPGIGTFTLGSLTTGNLSLTDTSGGPVTLMVLGAFNANANYSGVMSGNGSLTKAGLGLLVLNGANTFSGQTNITGGTLQVSNSNALQNSTVAPNAGLKFNTAPFGFGTYVIGGLTGSGSLSLQDFGGGYAVVMVGNNDTDTVFGGNISGPSGSRLIKIGTGTLTLGGVNTYSGGTTVNGGILNVTGSLTGNGSNNVFIAAGNDFSSASLVRSVSSGASYAGFGATASGGAPGSLITSADIRAGLSGGTRNLAMQWRVRGTADGPGIASDILQLTGMGGATGAHVQTDAFALQMGYNPAALGGDESTLAAEGLLALGWLNSDLNSPNGLWQNATAGDFGSGLPGDVFTNVQSSWDDFAAANSITDANVGNFLGSYGVDVAHHEVWAIVNHNSQFAAVPEPSPIVSFTAALVILAGWAVHFRHCPSRLNRCSQA